MKTTKECFVDDLESVLFDEDEFADEFLLERDTNIKIVLIESDEYEVNSSAYRAFLAKSSEISLCSIADGDVLLLGDKRFEVMNFDPVDGDRATTLIAIKEI